ncbi:CoA-binding protein [Romboutsia maritimum]|uniref:CoA-binding protein n=1 Tax=Romboutsia maritimum TaxID=2020948 RepID=A0A371ITB6_9FIRM|nr:CoA-binding protein [Romboutsia maritimum]RDY23736.1 CoA-binding protein [Romboutsia maritimum]
MNLEKFNSWAVVIKDTDNEGKVYDIIKILAKKNRKVVGISDEKACIDGIDIYESLKDVPYNVDIVVIVEESLKIYSILEEMELLDINNILFEKDSYNEIILKKAKDMKLNIGYDFSLFK